MIYDRSLLKFKQEFISGLEDFSFEATPHVVFLTNEQTKQPLVDFILCSDYIKMYQDVSKEQSHLRNSVDYHAGVVQPYIMNATGEVDTDSFARIQKNADFLNSVAPTAVGLGLQSLATIVIKPN